MRKNAPFLLYFLMVATALMRLSCLNELSHRFEYFVDFSPFTVDEIFSIHFQKIMIFYVLFFSPVTFFVVGIVWSIFSNSFLLLLWNCLSLLNKRIQFFSALFIAVMLGLNFVIKWLELFRKGWISMWVIKKKVLFKSLISIIIKTSLV